MDASSPSSSTFRRFEIQNGLVISETGQQDADDFAADFQGLRHFANRVGATLELGDATHATLHEASFSFIFTLSEAPGQPAKAVGGMVASNVSNNDLLNAL
ncbi:hypothetical protein FEM03_22840 [Phragmitibacter flavus]|uniref:Uncharacterized protein n=1 Tax=Phragmitibacter flavus TaxID=2576071 RepID=A0A5R8K7Z7_9BACT|nr:hypothetical protein [Phragmitibacter flavus]TLD68443.1 hypothetical protein FEM03_22840 [Phragmitibacter flavus]